MANIKSAKKRIRVIEAKTLQNKMTKSALKTAIKKAENAEGAEKAEAIKAATKKVDQKEVSARQEVSKLTKFTPPATQGGVLFFCNIFDLQIVFIV